MLHKHYDEPIAPRRNVIDFPFEGQSEYITGNPAAVFRLALAGRQGGKTQMGVQEFARELFQNTNEVFMIVAPTYKILAQATLLKLEEVLREIYPAGWIIAHNRVEGVMRDRNNNIIFVRSCERPDTLRGPTLKGALFDEAALVPIAKPFRILRAALAVKGGRMYITTTPYGPNWLLQEVIKPWEKGDKRYHVAKWRSVDNPAFPMEEYEDAKKYQDPRWVAQEYDAEITGFGGLVFPEFVEGIHVGQPEYDPLLPVYWGMDFGWANPTYIGFWQIEPPNMDRVEPQINMIDELQIKQTPIDEILETALGMPYKKPDLVFCDPTGSHHEKTSGAGATDIMTVEPFNLSVMHAHRWNYNADRTIAINKMHRLLKTQRILFHEEKCWNMIRAFQLYSRPQPQEGKRADEKPIKDGVSDHPMEATWYFMLGKPEYFYTSDDDYALHQYEELNPGTGM